jgi:hypothetical protein
MTAVRTPRSTELSTGRLSAAGKRAAQTIFRHGPRRARYTEHFDPVYVRAALDELERLITTETPGLYAEQRDGIDAAAEDLHVRAERALAEIAQNADDCGAHKLRFALREGPHGRELLCAHDGTRVTLRDAVGMTFAYISGKQGDAHSKGKFGIGLKTISGMARSFEVHCAPYHFTVERQHPEWTVAQDDVAGFWNRSSGNTLLVLRLHDGYDADAAVEWLREWDSGSMLFLDTLREIRFSDLDGGVLAELALSLESSETLQLPGFEAPIELCVMRDRAVPERAWSVYRTEVVAPAHLRRAHKQRERTTPVGVAIACHAREGQVFAGLPLEEPCELPFSVNGQLDPDTSRGQVKRTDWNKFVIEQFGALVSAVVLHRFSSEPASAWSAVPLSGEGAGRDDWTSARFADMAASVTATVVGDARIGAGEPAPRLDQLCYEDEALEGLVDSSDLVRLRPGLTALVPGARDDYGHWRAVLCDLGGAAEITSLCAASMLEWEEPDLGNRSMQWLASLLDAILAGGEDHARILAGKPALPTETGGRIAPSAARARGLILTKTAGSSLAETLGLSVQVESSFLDAGESRERVSSWLRDTIGIRERPSAERVLTGLANRDPDEPLALDHSQLAALRDGLAGLSAGRFDELAAKIGSRILLPGYETLRGGGRRELPVRPSDAYLPARIDGHVADGFPEAAKGLPGLKWISPKLAEALKTPRGSRKLAARALLLGLGAHAAPRLVPVAETETLHDQSAAPLPCDLPETQRLAIRKLGTPDGEINGLRNDHHSPDLMRVLERITRLRGAERSRAARALVLSLDREWDRRYAAYAHATAMHGYGWWYERGNVPATWLAEIQGAPFLTNESGRKKAPRDLALRSDTYVAVMGEDRSTFCRELRDGDITVEVAEALGFDPRPRASRIIDQLFKLRELDSRSQISNGEVAERALRSFMALASYCREARGSAVALRGSDAVDDVTVDQLRARFAEGTGLVHAASGWHRPSAVYRGAPIFADRRIAVPNAMGELWESLKINEPTISDCIEVLNEIAAGDCPPDPGHLRAIYAHVEASLATGQKGTAPLRRMPLETTDGWRAARPIFAVGHQTVARALGRRVAIWQPPAAFTSLPRLIKAAGITVIEQSEFELQGINPQHKSAGARYRPHFVAAVREFAAAISIGMPELMTITAGLGIDQLEELELAHSKKLEVLVPIGPGEIYAAPIDVFASAEDGLIAFRDPDALGRREHGGAAIAALLRHPDPFVIGAQWEVAWHRADPENLRERVWVARQQEVAGDPIGDLRRRTGGGARALIKGGSGSSGPREPRAGKRAPAADANPPSRRVLRKIDDVDPGHAEITGEPQRGQSRPRTRRPMKNPDRTPEPRSSRPRAGIREYDEQAKETAGFELLAKALQSLNGSELGDYRHMRNIGSDAIDNLKRHFELKAHEGDIPDEISLTSAEVERALQDEDRWFLAVVGGLETGQMIVRVFAHPLRSLDLISSGGLRLGGVRTRDALEWRPTTNR